MGGGRQGDEEREEKIDKINGGRERKEEKHTTERIWRSFKININRRNYSWCYLARPASHQRKSDCQ